MKFKIILATIAVIVTTSCSGITNKQPAEDFMKNYYKIYNENKIDNLLDLYSAEFYKTNEREKWKNILTKIHKKLGALESSNLKSWNIKKMTSTQGRGTYYILNYAAIFKNYSASEKVVLLKKKGSEKILINAHHFQSDAFLD